MQSSYNHLLLSVAFFNSKILIAFGSSNFHALNLHVHTNYSLICFLQVIAHSVHLKNMTDTSMNAELPSVTVEELRDTTTLGV